MRRRTGAAVVAAACVLAACGGDAGEDGRTRVELVVAGDPVETAGYRAMLDAFAQAVPDVDVELTAVAKQDQLLARLTTAFAGGQPPDVFLVNYRSYGQFAEQGALEPVQPFLDRSTAVAESDFAPVSLDAFRYDGEQLTCMPQNASSLAVYWNQDLFAAAGVAPPRPGWTWDDLLAAARALTDGETYGVGVEPSLIRLAPLVWSAGGELVDDTDAPTTLTVDRGPARAALDRFLDLSLVHGVVPPDAAEQSQDALARFVSGGLGMYLDSRRAVPTLREIDGFAWDVAPLPVVPGGEPATILHGDAYCLSAHSPVHDAAWRLVEFAMGGTGQRLLAESGRTVPSRLDVARSPAFLDPSRPPASSQVFLDALPTARAVPHVGRWPEVEQQVDKALADVFYGRVAREQGVRALVAESARLLRR